MLQNFIQVNIVCTSEYSVPVGAYGPLWERASRQVDVPNHKHASFSCWAPGYAGARHRRNAAILSVRSYTCMGTCGTLQHQQYWYPCYTITIFASVPTFALARVFSIAPTINILRQGGEDSAQCCSQFTDSAHLPPATPCTAHVDTCEAACGRLAGARWRQQWWCRLQLPVSTHAL